MKTHSSICPIACSLDLLGDRWSLLIMRDILIFKKSKFSDFLNSPEKISTNILTDKLNQLERQELISKKLYQWNPQRYEYKPTKLGLGLKKTLDELIKWGSKYKSRS